MTIIERIKDGYKVTRAQYGRHNGREFYRNEAGQWFADEDMKQPITSDPIDGYDDADEEMIQRFITDPKLNQYIDAGMTDYLLDEFADAIGDAGADIGDPLYATRDGKVTASATGNQKFGVMPENDSDICDLWSFYISALTKLI